MARRRGRDDLVRVKKTKELRREVYVFTEGEVTEPSFISFVTHNGTRRTPHKIACTVENRSAPTKRRKPLPLVEDAIRKWDEVQRAAKKAGIEPEHWNWPQVWCLFDRDQHEDISTAFARAKKAKLHIAYSHPCFELWRLLHYQDYTSSFGGVCDKAADRLRQQPGFVQTYPKDRFEPKRVMPAQLTGRYKTARRYAQGTVARHGGRPDQNTWDAYTDIWKFVEDGLDVVDY
ncbi:RloB domain-containing protein [Streptomyces sp. F001]|uniref:RloB family protein n=1 Tax=Streptomyces sp. F001 TaxID=1510026 RepID=UPI00101E3F66|nr:RloB family protein [Streptomyces sp. F001]RZB17639.1 RloB domain-containing protein [Streptomyces sp. F001]